MRFQRGPTLRVECKSRNGLSGAEFLANRDQACGVKSFGVGGEVAVSEPRGGTKVNELLLA